MIVTIKTDSLYHLITKDDFKCFSLYPSDTDFDNETSISNLLRTKSASSKEELIEELKDTFENVFENGSYIIEMKKSSKSHGNGLCRFRINLKDSSSSPQEERPIQKVDAGLSGLKTVQDFTAFRKDVEEDIKSNFSQIFAHERALMRLENTILQQENRIKDLEKQLSDAANEHKKQLAEKEEELKEFEKELDYLEKHKDNLSDRYVQMGGQMIKMVAQEVPQLQGIFDMTEAAHVVNDAEDTVEL